MCVCRRSARSTTSFFRSAYRSKRCAPFGPRESQAAISADETAEPLMMMKFLLSIVTDYPPVSFVESGRHRCQPTLGGAPPPFQDQGARRGDRTVARFWLRAI